MRVILFPPIPGLALAETTAGLLFHSGTSSSSSSSSSYPRLSTLWLLSLPASFVLCLPYSESLYLPLASGLLLSLLTQRPLLSLVLALLLPIARSLAVFLCFPLLIYSASHRTLPLLHRLILPLAPSVSPYVPTLPCQRDYTWPT